MIFKVENFNLGSQYSWIEVFHFVISKVRLLNRIAGIVKVNKIR